MANGCISTGNYVSIIRPPGTTFCTCWLLPARHRRDVSTAQVDALDNPVPTVKGHTMRARREGFLTGAEDCKEGGDATDKTRDVIANT